MRLFPFKTLGTLLEALKKAGVPIKRPTYYRLEKRLNLPKPRKTSGALQWRVYTEEEITLIVSAIKKEYNIQ